MPWLAVKSSAGVSSPPSSAGEARLGGLVTGDQVNLPIRVGRGQLCAQRASQQVCAEVGGAVVGWLVGEEGRSAGALDFALLRGYDAGCVAGVFLRRVEVNAPDRVLHIQLVLELVGDFLRVAHEQQVVGHLNRVGGTGANAVPLRNCCLIRLGGRPARLRP